MSLNGSIRGAAAAQLGFDYQLDVSILAALQLLLISKATTRLVLEPANEEDLEADLAPDVPGRMQSSAMIAGAYKLVVQVKRSTGEPWSIDDFKKLLQHGSDNPGGRRKALHHLNDLDTRYLLVTTASVKGVARGLLVNGFEEAADKGEFPGSLRDTLKTSPEGRVGIWGGLTEKQLDSDLRDLMSDLLHVPRPEQANLLAKLRSEAKLRTRGASPGIWTRDDLLATIRNHGGFLSSLASLEHFAPPTNFDEMVGRLKSKGAIVIRGPSGTGKTQAALKLCEIARQLDGRLEVVVLGADDSPTSARKLVDHGPTLFYIEDPWGQYTVRESADSWTEQLPRLLAKASPDHQFVITSRSDMMRKAQNALNPWSVELDAEQYRSGQLRKIYGNRMNQLPPALQSKAYAFRNLVLNELETPFEIDLYFTNLAQGPEPEEADHAFVRRLLKIAHRDAVVGVVINALEANDTSGTAAIIWALLTARSQFDRGQLSPLQRALRPLNRDLGDGLDKLIDQMVAARHLRQPMRAISFAHPSVRQGFESFVLNYWLRSEEAIQHLVEALTQLPGPYRAWGVETAARVVETTRSLLGREGGYAPLEINEASQAAIDDWLEEGLIDPASDFSPLLTLASEVGSAASIPSRVAHWLLKSTQRDASFFIKNWQPPLFDDAWYEVVSADPRSSLVAARFIREQLGFDRGLYGVRFAERLDRIAPNVTSAYLDAALKIVGNGFEMNADAIAAGAIRDLDGYGIIVSAALDDLSAVRRRYEQSYAEEWRAIEDGERDAAAEEAMQSSHEGDGYTSSIFIEVYIRRLRSEGLWQVIAEHPRVAELVRYWARDLHRSEGSPSKPEAYSILDLAKGNSDESGVWSAIAQHWRSEFEQRLAARIADCVTTLDLRRALSETALAHATDLLVKGVENLSATPSRQLMLLADIGRASSQIGVEDRGEALKPVTDHLAPEFVEIIMAFPAERGTAGTVKSTALKILVDNVRELDSETLSLVVPVIALSGGNASDGVALWLSLAKSKDDALAACKMAIEIDNRTLVTRALSHPRADARQTALLHLAPSLPDPLPGSMLALSADPSARVRQALLSVISERQHSDHLKTLLGLMHDQWSSADYHFSNSETYKIAHEAVIALANYAPLPDAIGDMLLELADETSDRTLSQMALIVAANTCSARIQQKISNLVSLTEERWIRLDALEALAGAQVLDPSITAHLDPTFLTSLPPVLAAHAAHLVGAHATEAVALALFTSVASVNRRRVLLLVGATAMAVRNRKVADQILDLLEPGHPARQILNAPEPLPLSVLDDLGSVALREYARQRLGERIVEG
jgi:hypothetical protein